MMSLLMIYFVNSILQIWFVISVEDWIQVLSFEFESLKRIVNDSCRDLFQVLKHLIYNVRKFPNELITCNGTKIKISEREHYGIEL